MVEVRRAGPPTEKGAEMRKRTAIAIAAGAVIAVLAIGTGVGVAASGDDDRPLTGNDFDRATRAALHHVGGGTVVETEMGDDGTAYGVEVRRDDGSVVEVNLNADFQVIGSTEDDDGPGGGEAGDTDD
jgi:uncharacterized membrane protein YkoI